MIHSVNFTHADVMNWSSDAMFTMYRSSLGAGDQVSPNIELFMKRAFQLLFIQV